MTRTTDTLLASIMERLDAIETALDRLTYRPADREDMLNVVQAAAFLGVTPSSLYHMDLPKYKTGRGGKTSRSYYKRADLQAYVQRKRVASRQEEQARCNVQAMDY